MTDVKVTARMQQSQVQGQGMQAQAQNNNDKDVPMVSGEAQAQNQRQDMEMGLKVEVTTPKTTKKTPTNNTTNNTSNHTVTNTNSGNYVGMAGGNVVIGNNNTVGGDNSVNVSGSQNNVNINTQPKADGEEEPPTPPVQPDKPTIPGSDRAAGKSLALRLHAQTDSVWANNGTIANVFGAVTDKTAYTFFKEYQKLADGDANAKTKGSMHDTYDVSDTFNTLNVEVTNPAVKALLNQAAAIGLEGADEYADLDTLVTLADQENSGILSEIKTPDLSKSQAKNMDDAIKALIAKMDEIYQ